MRIILQWSTDGHPGGGSENFVVEIPHAAIRWVRIRAWLHGVLRLPAFSEFAAPLLIAAAAALGPLLAPDPDEQLDTHLIDSFWCVYATTDMLSFDGELPPLHFPALDKSSPPPSE